LSERYLEEIVATQNAPILNALFLQTNRAANNLGIMLIDMRFKAIDLTKEGVQNIYEHMRAQSTARAASLRAVANTKAEVIKKNAEANVRLTLANAQVQASKLRGEGDAKAAQIYSQAYSQDPDFYGFYRRMMIYQNVLNKNAVLVLKTDNQLFKYFDNLTGQ
jgi:membrane protease subunit HflC